MKTRRTFFPALLVIAAALTPFVVRVLADAPPAAASTSAEPMQSGPYPYPSPTPYPSPSPSPSPTIPSFDAGGLPGTPDAGM